MYTFFSTTFCGISGQLIEVEVDVINGMGQFSIVGLWDAAIQESKERVRSAIKNSGFKFPGGSRITVNLAPADIRKKWPLYDLPIALGILAKEEDMDRDILSSSLFLGELALDGRLRPISWALSAAILAKSQGIKHLFIPEANQKEASVIPDIEIHPIVSLSEAVDIVCLRRPMTTFWGTIEKNHKQTALVSLDAIKWQEFAKRALIIAAAGGHNMLMEWPPGSWKTLLAKALAGLLPPMELEEQIELSQIYSVAGLLSKETPLMTQRPFRKVHHTASEVAIIGGGRDARPGEISLAHRWVLFLDEFLEFPKTLLECLRQPLEDGEITINRIHQSARYPARFSLIGAMNPCPCWYLWDPEKPCTCSVGAIERYRWHLSGPILDRIDISIRVPRVKIGELGEVVSKLSNKNAELAVLEARKWQKERFFSIPIYSNAEMTNQNIETLAKIREDAKRVAIDSTDKLKLSTRVYYRILRVARTIADIDRSTYVEVRHVLEALSYRWSHTS